MNVHSIDSSEWEVLARHAQIEAEVWQRIQEQDPEKDWSESIERWQAKARTYKEMAAVSDDDQRHYEKTGNVRLRRVYVTFDDVIDYLADLIEGAVEHKDGVRKLAYTVARDSLLDAWPEGAEEVSPNVEG